MIKNNLVFSIRGWGIWKMSDYDKAFGENAQNRISNTFQNIK